MNIHLFTTLHIINKSIRVLLDRFGRLFIFLILLCSLLGGSSIRAQAATTITFTAQELLGKPEATSITINIIPASTIEYHYQYGLTSGANTWSTSNATATGGQPSEVTITGLTPNTQYFYHMQYHLPGETDWVDRSEHSFWTQRAQGSTFTFVVTSDNHENFNSTSQNTYGNIANEHPDFLIDLGDTFLLDGTTSQSSVNTHYLNSRKPNYFDKFDAQTPIFLASGNHEDEEGWNLDDTPFSIALGSIQARKLYYPTPIQDGFYTGNTNILATIDAGTYGDQLREDYYAWTWGDALFVVIDEFQYTMHNPYGATAGEGSDDPKTCEFTNDPNCQWNWTLGPQQYQWFKQTLENSQAKYKFIFSHNMLGGKLTVDGSSQPGYVRGGCQGAPYFEWGGKNADGTEGFVNRRTATYGADAEPLRQIMMDNGVSAYFHGHDHQYVYETCDNMVYQEVPSPGMSGGGFADYTEGDHGTYNTVKILPNAGHLRITITPSLATVDYISASSTAGTVNYSYTIAPSVTGPTHDLTTAVSPASSGTINPAAGEHSYTEGSLVPITAIAASGYKFDHWSGDCTGSGACSVTMDADKSVTAVFTLIKARDDYDGDGKTDAVKFVASSGTAWWFKSSTSAWDGMWLGTENMNYVGASDFDGDGKTDLAKFIPSTGAVWYYLSNTSAWDGKWLGPEAFTYVAGSDFDGDGKTDPAKFVPSTGAVWYLQSSTGTWDGKWLGPEALTYVAGSDFDGDGKTDPAKFVPSTKVLWYLGSKTGTWTGVYMGSETFSYVPASDFDGDGKTDPAKFIASTGVLWYLSSLSSSWVGVSLGTGTYTYIPGCDFNNDGKTEPAKYDESTHWLSWYNGSTWANIDMGTDTFTIGNGQ